MIRNFILRQMRVNRYGLLQNVKYQESEHQKKFLELQSQYKNTQNIDQQMEIMKGIINIRHQIDEQDNISLETIHSYYRFINDYKTCKRKRLKINKETADLYNQVYQRFIDQTIFDKITENDIDTYEKKFLLFNSLIYQFEEKFEQRELEQLDDIILKIFAIAEEAEEAEESRDLTHFFQLQVQILAFLMIGDVLQTIGDSKKAGAPLKEGLELIQQLKQYYDNHQIQMTQSDKEWLFQIEGKFLFKLALYYYELGQNQSFIEYQEKALQLIKNFEGISQYYCTTLYHLNNMLGKFDLFRALKLIEESCSNIEKNEGYLLLQLLDQLNIKEYNRIIKLHQEVQIIDDHFQIEFFSTILMCAIRLKYYSDIIKWIDLMFSCVSNITLFQIELVVFIRKMLYEEFQDNRFLHNKNVYEQTMLYYHEKTDPFFALLLKQFNDESYLTYSMGVQRKLNGKVKNIMKDYMYRSIYNNDQHLIKVTLENTFKLYQSNPNYRNPLLSIFQELREMQNLQPHIKALLSKYIKQLGQNNNLK